MQHLCYSDTVFLSESNWARKNKADLTKMNLNWKYSNVYMSCDLQWDSVIFDVREISVTKILMAVKNAITNWRAAWKNWVTSRFAVLGNV